MSEREFEAYLNLLARFLKLSPEQRAAIEKELRDHLEQRLEELYEKGYSRDDAIETALAEFGDAAGLADDFAKATRGPRIRRRIMQTSIGTLAAAAAIALVFTFMLPEQRPGVPERPTGWAANGQADDDRVTAARTIRTEPLAADDAAMMEKLDQPITIEMDDGTVGELFELLEQATGVPFEVPWAGPDAELLDVRDAPFSLHVHETVATDVLLMLREELRWVSLRGIHIAPDRVVVGGRSPFITRLYDVRDLLGPNGPASPRARALQRYTPLAAGIVVSPDSVPQYATVYDGLLAFRIGGFEMHESFERNLAMLRTALVADAPVGGREEIFTEQAVEAGLLAAQTFEDEQRLREEVSLDVADEPLYRVLGALRAQTGMRLAARWDEEHFSPHDRVTVSVSDVPAEQALQAIAEALDAPLHTQVNWYGIAVLSHEDEQPGARYAIRLYDVSELLGDAAPESPEARALLEMLGSGSGARVAAAAAIALAFTFLLPEHRPGVPERPSTLADVADEAVLAPDEAELTEQSRRARLVAVIPEAAERALDQRVSIEVVDGTMTDVLQQLREGLDVSVGPRGLAPEEFWERELTFEVRDVPVREALQRLDEHLPEHLRVEVAGSNAGIRITATEAPDLPLFEIRQTTHVYDVRDLLAAPTFEGALDDREQALIRTINLLGFRESASSLQIHYSIYDGMLFIRHMPATIEAAERAMMLLRESRALRERLPELDGASAIPSEVEQGHAQ